MPIDVSHRCIVQIYFARDNIVSPALLSFRHTGMLTVNSPTRFSDNNTFPVGFVLEILWNCHSTYIRRFTLSLVFQSSLGLAR